MRGSAAAASRSAAPAPTGEAIRGVAAMGLRPDLAITYLIVYTLCSFGLTAATAGVEIGRVLIAYLAMVIAGVLLVYRPTGPMPRPAMLFGVLAPSIMVVVGFPALPLQPLLPAAVLAGGSAALAGFLGVRCHPLIGTGAYALSFACGFLVLPTDAGLSTETWLAVSAPYMAVVVALAIFAGFIHRAGESIAIMRRRTRHEISRRSESTAFATEREDQLRRFDDIARGTLDRIAAGGTMTADDLLRCRLTEARLRDAIRAPALDRDDLGEAVWAARRSGVGVLLLDDRGPRAADDLPEEAIATVVAAASSVLADLASARPASDAGGRAGSAHVTIRLVPPGRGPFATMVVRGWAGDGSEDERHEFTSSGSADVGQI